MLGHCPRRWAKIKTTLTPRIDFAAIPCLQSQKAVSAYLTSNQILTFGFARMYPRKQDTLSQCWANVGPASTLVQHSPNIGSMRVCLLE